MASSLRVSALFRNAAMDEDEASRRSPLPPPARQGAGARPEEFWFRHDGGQEAQGKGEGIGWAHFPVKVIGAVMVCEPGLWIFPRRAKELHAVERKTGFSKEGRKEVMGEGSWRNDALKLHYDGARFERAHGEG
jgi:hypothetical protein